MAQPPQAPLAEHVAQADATHAQCQLSGQSPHAAAQSTRPPSPSCDFCIVAATRSRVAWSVCANCQVQLVASLGDKRTGTETLPLLFSHLKQGCWQHGILRSGGRSRVCATGLRDPPPSAQLQKTDNHNVLVNVLVEVHPGTRRQQCLIGVERSVHPSDGHALLR